MDAVRFWNRMNWFGSNFSWLRYWSPRFQRPTIWTFSNKSGICRRPCMRYLQSCCNLYSGPAVEVLVTVPPIRVSPYSWFSCRDCWAYGYDKKLSMSVTSSKSPRQAGDNFYRPYRYLILSWIPLPSHIGDTLTCLKCVSLVSSCIICINFH